ncbi:MAG TPA: flagellar hook-basal body complex protein FliE [Kofleriaceae bacterium]
MSGIRPIALPVMPQLDSIEGRTGNTKIGGGSPITGTPGTTDVGGSFAKALTEARGTESTATDMAEKFANGDQSIGIHEVMIATEKANIAVRYATTLKNKAIEAYKELMNTQV